MAAAEEESQGPQEYEDAILASVPFPLTQSPRPPPLMRSSPPHRVIPPLTPLVPDIDTTIPSWRTALTLGLLKDIRHTLTDANARQHCDALVAYLTDKIPDAAELASAVYGDTELRYNLRTGSEIRREQEYRLTYGR